MRRNFGAKTTTITAAAAIRGGSVDASSMDERDNTQVGLADLQALQGNLGYTFKNVFLLISALDRTKLNSEGDGNTTPDYESLEFLGDRVINLIAAGHLVGSHPDANASTLNDFYVTFIRNTDSHERGSRLHRVAVALNLESLIHTRPNSPLNAHGERGKNRNKKRKTQEQKLADHVEALFGAIYLDCGKSMHITQNIFDQLFRRWLRADDHHTVYSGDSGETVVEGGRSGPAVPQRANASSIFGGQRKTSPKIPPPPSKMTTRKATTREGSSNLSSSNDVSESINQLFLSLIKQFDDEDAHNEILKQLEPRLSVLENQVIQFSKKGQLQFLESQLSLGVSDLVFNMCFYFSVKERKTNVVPYLMKNYGGKIAKEVFDQCLIISNNSMAAHGFLKTLKNNEYSSLEELCPGTELPVSDNLKLGSTKNRVGNRKGLRLAKNDLPYIPDNFIVGEAIDDGGCFFDSLAQSLNILKGQDIYDEKLLREQCCEYYLANKEKVKDRNKKDYGGIDASQGDEYAFVQYTKDELDEHFNGRPPIWGRPQVEGKILCRQLTIEALYIIELIKNPDNPKQLIPAGVRVTADEVKAIDIDDQPINFSSFPCLIVSQGSLHFVPVLPKRAPDNRSSYPHDSSWSPKI